MQTRTLGKSGFKVSEIGLGCWQLGGDFGPLNDEKAHDILAAADQSGITFWDTADVYGGGVSEQRIAAYLHREANHIIVASKVGKGGGLFPNDYEKQSVRACVEQSARRLNVDTIDLVQLHCVPPEVLKAGDILAWMEDFQDQGLIRAFGASVETLDEALFAARHPRLTSLQIIFNLFRQNAISELFPLAEANEVGIIVRLPLASGVLSGTMSADRQFAKSDHRHYNRHGEHFSVGETFSGVPMETAVGFVETMKAWLPNGMSMAEMAIRWILDYPAVSTVIAGATRPDQVIQNAAVSGIPPLSATVHDKLAVMYKEEIEPVIQVPI